MKLIGNKFNVFTFLVLPAVALLTLAVTNCSAQYPQNEQSALENLRRLTLTGKLPSESVVADVERRFPNTRTSGLAKILRARIKIENGEYLAASELLEAPEIESKTKLADHAKWLRGSALLNAGKRQDAYNVFKQLLDAHPNSTRADDARFAWAESLLKDNRAEEAVSVLKPLVDVHNGKALLMTSDAYDKLNNSEMSIRHTRLAYFYAPSSSSGKEAKKRLEENNVPLTAFSAEEAAARASGLFDAKEYGEASREFDNYARLGGSFDDDFRLKQIKAAARSNNIAGAEFGISKLPKGSKSRAEAYYEVIVAEARQNRWDEAQGKLTVFRREMPKSDWVPKAFVELADIAGSKRRRSDKDYFLKSALSLYPDAVENTKAHFELSWEQHEAGNFAESSRMLTEHLARYVDKDNSYRGKSGYWAARDSERAGKMEEACALYDATAYRYGANWYGYQALERIANLRRQGKCQTSPKFAADSTVGQAVANLKVVTVSAETATSKEFLIAERSEELSTIGLFDWAIEELNVAKKSAKNSPRLNLALAKYYRHKGDNVRALLSLADSYPDYPQMFPEEMGKEEWDIFYPLTNWKDIKYWANQRRLDPYNVAGLIRQETIFDADARSRANAYGLMQLLIPTARMMARKYGRTDVSITGSRLYDPKLNIELGTAYMKDQLERFGRIEYMSVAYNAGPGRAVSWKRTLPLQMDEFVEKIPFRETQGYVKGIIRNSAQYRRLYDESGNFKSNVGTNRLRGQIDSIPAKDFSAANPEINVDRVRQTAE